MPKAEPAFLLRPATLQDVPGMTEIYNEAILSTTAHYYAEPKSLDERIRWFHDHGDRHPIYVAEKDGHILGWASLTRWSVYPAFEDSAESSFYIHREHRGKGLGKALLKKVIQEGEAKGLHTIVARILDGNPASIRIHEQLGFTHTGVIREIGKKFGRYIDLVLMQRMCSRQ
jgi:L-amino acid N-acyltransferase